MPERPSKLRDNEIGIRKGEVYCTPSAVFFFLILSEDLILKKLLTSVLSLKRESSYLKSSFWNAANFAFFSVLYVCVFISSSDSKGIGDKNF